MSPPYLMGAPFGSGRDALFDYDFTTLPLGGMSAADFLTATAKGNKAGLIFTRASAATVQTSASTIDSTPGVNYARIGCRDALQAHRGLVLQQKTNNRLTHDPRSSTGWSAGETTGSNGFGGSSSTQTNNAAVSPDGQTKATHVVTHTGTRGSPAYSPSITDGAYGYYEALSASGFRYSCWYNGGDVQMAVNDGGNPTSPTSLVNGKGLFSADTGDWRRVEFSADNVQYYAPVDGRGFTDWGGVGPAAYDVYTDFPNATRGNYSVEPIATGAGVIEPDYLSYGNGSDLVSISGQIKVHARFTPKFASTDTVSFGNGPGDVSTGFMIFSYQNSGNSYAYVRQSDHKLVAKIGAMSEIVSSFAVPFGKYDFFEIFLAIGAGLPTLAFYKLNGGAWTTLTLGTVSNTPNPSTNPIYLFCAPFDGVNANDRWGIPSWQQRLTILNRTLPLGL